MPEATFAQVTQPSTSAPVENSGGDFIDRYMADNLEGDDQAEGQTDDTETPAEPQEQETPENEEDGEQEEGEEEASTHATVSFKGVKPSVVAKMKQFAAADGLDLANPDHFKLYRRIAEKEIYIEEQKLSATTPEVDDFMKRLEGNAEVPAAETAKQGADEQPEWVALNNTWKSEADWTSAVVNNWEQIANASTPEEHAAASRSMFNNQMAFMENAFMYRYAPMLLAQIEREYGQKLKPVIQEVDTRERQTLRSQIVGEMKGVKEFEGIEELDRQLSNDPFVWDGREWDDTLLNRVLATNPSILQIKGKNPRHTLALQLSKAWKLSQGMRTTTRKPEVAKSALEAGKAIEQSKRSTSAVKAGLNAGKSGNNTGEQTKKRASDMWTPAPDGVPFSDLVSKV